MHYLLKYFLTEVFKYFISLWLNAKTFERSHRGYLKPLVVAVHCDQNSTTFARSHRGYLLPLVVTVHCDHRPQYLRGHIEAIYNLWWSQFIVMQGHNI